MDETLVAKAEQARAARLVREHQVGWTVFSSRMPDPSASRMPSRCSKCGKELDAAALIQCENCHRAFCNDHIDVETIGHGSVQRTYRVCGRCSLISNLMLLGFGIAVLLVLLIGVPAVSKLVAGHVDGTTAFAIGMCIIVLGTVGRFVLWAKGKAGHVEVRLLVLGLIIVICTIFLAVNYMLH